MATEKNAIAKINKQTSTLNFICRIPLSMPYSYPFLIKKLF